MFNLSVPLIELVLVVALVRIMIEYRRPFVCASVYAAVLLAGHAIAVFMDAIEIGESAVRVGIQLVIAFLYFWLVDRMEELSTPWWITLTSGIVVLVLIV